VDAFEEGLRALGFRQLRVRFHNEVARVEVEPEAMARALELRETMVKLGRKLGFTFVALDLAGFTSGSLNQLIGIRPAPARPSNQALGISRAVITPSILRSFSTCASATSPSMSMML